MTGSPIGDALQRDRGWFHRAEHEVADAMRDLMRPGHHGHHDQHDAPQPAATATNQAMPTTQESPVGFATTLKHDAAELLGRVGQLDEAMLDRAEQISKIDGAPELVDTLLAIGHVPPSLISVFTAMAKEVAKLAPAPEPAADPVTAAIAAQAAGGPA